jgi:histidyl-tRNA synthetase
VKSERVQRALEGAPKIGDSLCEACREQFEHVRAYLDALGVAYTLVPTLVRGLDYYTRTTFEFKDEALGAQDSICGGGRYDGLIEAIGGPPTPGIGFGAGVERLLLSIGEREEQKEHIDVFFAVGDGVDRSRVLAAMAALRARGLACDADYAGRSKKGQLTQAARLGARTTVVVDADGSRIVRRGGDEPTTLEELVARLAK